MTWTPPPGLKAVLFDKDGTLVDFDETWQTINWQAARVGACGNEDLARRLAAACGMDPQTGETVADSLFAAGNATEIAAHMVLHGSLVAHGELVAELDRIFAEGAENPVPVCDLPAVMRMLRGAGFRIGIASSDNERAVRRSAERLAIAEFVEFYAGYDSGHGPKPEPGMIHGFCAAVGVDAATVAMIGDNRHDMVMARAAGAGAAVSVLSGTGTRETLGDIADICIASVEHLPALLMRG